MLFNQKINHKQFGSLGLTTSCVALVAAGLLATGCASQTTVDHSRDTNRALQQRIVELEQGHNATQGTIDDLRVQAQNANQRASAAESSRQAAVAGLSQAQNDYDDLLTDMDQLDLSVLPADLDAALRSLAGSNSNLMTYDAARGMIVLSSDLTFELGSDSLKAGAGDSIRILAGLLNGPDAANFQVRVVGHTDNVPINRPATRQKHPTNMHLAVHRAISVRAALVAAGADPRRVSVGGWGEHRPVVTNPTKGGAQANRRVDIYLEPMTADLSELPSAADSSSGGTTTAPNAPAATNNLGSEPMK